MQTATDTSPLLTQADIHEATEEELREVLVLIVGDRCEAESHAAIRTALVMATLAVAYESWSQWETLNQFNSRRNDIMATTIKGKLEAALNAKGAARATKPAPEAAAATKPAAVGRAPRFAAIKINPEGGSSKVGETSERGQVLALIKAAGEKGITIEKLDEKFASVQMKLDPELQRDACKGSRGFVSKLLEKQHVIVTA